MLLVNPTYQLLSKLSTTASKSDHILRHHKQPQLASCTVLLQRFSPKWQDTVLVNGRWTRQKPSLGSDLDRIFRSWNHVSPLKSTFMKNSHVILEQIFVQHLISRSMLCSTDWISQYQWFLNHLKSWITKGMGLGIQVVGIMLMWGTGQNKQCRILSCWVTVRDSPWSYADVSRGRDSCLACQLSLIFMASIFNCTWSKELFVTLASVFEDTHVQRHKSHRTFFAFLAPILRNYVRCFRKWIWVTCLGSKMTAGLDSN